MRPLSNDQNLKSHRAGAGIGLAFVLLALTGIFAPPAFGSNAAVSGTDLQYTASAGETNQVTVTTSLLGTRITDPGANITPGFDCFQSGANTVDCISATSLTLDLGDMDDSTTINVAMPATVLGGDGDDVLNGGTQNDTLNGGDGDDTLDGLDGADTLNGGNDTDTATYASRTAAVTVDLDGSGDDGESGEGDNVAANVENVIGGSGNDTLTGSSDDNVLSGGPGTDTLDGLDGADVFNGGAGTDTVTYASRTNPVTVDIDSAPDDGEAGEGDDVETDVENLTGGSGADTLTGSSAANTLSGGGGGDTLAGLTGADVFNGDGGTDTVSYAIRTNSVTADIDGNPDDGEAGEGDNVETDVENLIGGSGADTLTGSSDDNVLSGGGGADTLDGRGGADVFNGGGNVDTVTYASHNNPVTVDIDGVADDGEAGEGDNVGIDVENVAGGSDDDVLTGSSSNNVLSGGGGDDFFDGLGGADVINGGSGSDTVTYASRTSGVTVDLDGFADDGASGENDNVGFDVENVIGGSAGDFLTGNAGANTLTGGTGDDTLDGGTGTDLLIGGSGTDTVTYASRSASVTADLDGTADDGEIGENDTIAADVENLIGGSGPDTLVGNAGANVLSGGGDDDLLDGGDGPDVLNGGAGASDTVTYASRTNPVSANLDGAADDGEAGENDTIRTDVENITGGSGADTIVGGPGGNSLSGGPGDDTIDGSAGVDGLSGGPGADTIISRDSVGDAVLCGTEFDTVIADQLDAITADCESVDRGPASGGSGGGNGTGGGGSGPGSGIPALVILDRGMTVDVKGNVRILVVCVGPGNCNGTSSVATASKMRIRPTTARRTFFLGGRSFSYPAGSSGAIRVRMRTSLFGLLVKRKSFLLRVTARVGESGSPRIATRRVRVRAPKAALRAAERNRCSTTRTNTGTASTAPARCKACPAGQARVRPAALQRSAPAGRASLRGTTRPSAKSTLPSTCRQDRSRPSAGSR
jgi:Ca2+-binding RTX toxin-like protein